MPTNIEIAPSSFVEPGMKWYYTLDELTRPTRHKDWNDWGVCEYEHHFWVGDRVSVEGKDTLRLSLAEIMTQRDEEYPDWGDEEVYLLVGRDHDGTFSWYLCSKPEFDKSESSNKSLH